MNNNDIVKHDAELICKWIRHHVPRYDALERDDGELYVRIPSPSNVFKDVVKATNVIENALDFLHLDGKYDYKRLFSTGDNGGSIHFFKITSIEEGSNTAEREMGHDLEKLCNWLNSEVGGCGAYSKSNMVSVTVSGESGDKPSDVADKARELLWTALDANSSIKGKYHFELDKKHPYDYDSHDDDEVRIVYYFIAKRKTVVNEGKTMLFDRILREEA